jgi:hypothetical protein
VKKNLLALILLILLFTTGWSQNTYLNYQSGLKLYNTSIFEEQSKSMLVSDTSSVRFQYTNTNSQILHPSIAFQWKSKTNNFHEIELTNFMLNKVGTKTAYVSDTSASGQLVSGEYITNTAFSLRYEYIVVFNKSKDSQVVPSIGFGVNPYFRRSSISYESSTSFPSSNQNIGLRTFVTPRITYFLTSKLFLDVNIPICLFDNFISTESIDNPAVPISQREISSYNFNQFPKFISGRVGIGLKL